MDTSASVSGETLVSVAAATSSDARAVGYVTGSNGGPIGAALRWSGATWAADGVSEPSVFNEVIADVVVRSPDYWAVGYDNGNGGSPGAWQPFALQANGAGAWQTSGQNGLPAVAVTGGRDNQLFAASVPATGDVWAVGTYVGTGLLARNLIDNYSGLSAPPTPAAAPGDQSATVTWAAPCDGGSAISSYVVTAYDGCTIQGSATVTGAPPATTVNFTGLTNGGAYTFKVAAVNGFGTGPQSGPSTSLTPSGSTKPTWVTVCSSRQYQLANNNGSTWVDMDAAHLSLTFTPAADSFAILSGNSDLWTAQPGYNQDLGIAVSGGVSPGTTYPTAFGQPEAWKESGGFAGTFSPNAAYAQTVIPVAMGMPYTAKLQWKTNRPDMGLVAAGAGPIGSAFSPTRLTVQIVPKASALVFTTSSTTQYTLTGSNGATWTDMDSTNLSLQFTPPTGTWMAYVSGNADLWTSSPGYNQDIGVTVSGGGAFPSTAGQPEVWKESGGFAGTFSPNAAFAEAPLAPALISGTQYTAKLQWKANKADPGSIYAGAGPISARFSPTTLTVILAAPTSSLGESELQYSQVNSDGAYWKQMDSSRLLWTPGTVADVDMRVSVNADLWTSVTGFNQDIGIMVSGGAYGPGTLVTWKESGGFAGTFSPNAALATVVLHLQAGNMYVFWVVWKTNALSTMPTTIFSGAGPINSNFSQTLLTAQQLN